MHDSQTDWKPYLEKYHCQNECHHIWHGFWEYHTFLCDISVNSKQVVLMLRYLHINNWFDISQSLLLAVILVIFPEHWNHSLLVTFLTFSFSYSPPTLTSFQYHHSNYTPSPAELSYTIFFLGTFVCVTVTSTSPFTVCIFLFIYHNFKCVLLYFTFLFLHIFAPLICVRCECTTQYYEKILNNPSLLYILFQWSKTSLSVLKCCCSSAFLKVFWSWCLAAFSIHFQSSPCAWLFEGDFGFGFS